MFSIENHKKYYNTKEKQDESITITTKHLFFVVCKKKVQVGNDQEKAQSERNSKFKTRDGNN